MKRRDFIKATGLGVAGATVAAPAIAQSMPELKWRMTTSWPKSLDTIQGGAELLSKAVAEATDNKFQIQVFAGGEIVPGLQVLDAVQNGTVEMGHTASYYYFGKDPTFGFGTSVAFGPNSRINQGWFTLGGGKEVLNEFYKGYNVISLLAGNTGCLLNEYPSDPTLRMQVLLNQSEDLRQIQAEWLRFWMVDHPSHMTYDRIDGGMQ